jgi:hypothetical protein
LLNIIAGTLSTGTPPAAPNSYESIATYTVGSGGSSSIDFTSIPSTYSHLQLRCLARGTSTSGGIALKAILNNDSTTIYTRHALVGDGASVSAGAATSSAYISLGSAPNANSLTSTYGVFVFDLLDYANTNKYKTVRILGGFDVNGSGGSVEFRSSLYMSTTAINRITLSMTSDNITQYSQFALYGIKGS